MDAGKLTREERAAGLALSILLLFAAVGLWAGSALGPTAERLGDLGLRQPALVVAVLLFGAVNLARQIGRPHTRAHWMWAILPLAAVLPLAWSEGSAARALRENSSSASLHAFARAIALLAAAYAIWIVGFPLETLFGPESRSQRRALRVVYVAAGLVLVGIVGGRALILAEGAGLADEAAHALRLWAASANALAISFCFARFLGPVVVATDFGRNPFPEAAARKALTGKIPWPVSVTVGILVLLPILFVAGLPFTVSATYLMAHTRVLMLVLACWVLGALFLCLRTMSW